MNDIKPANPDFEQAIRTSFAKQGIMRHIGATLTAIRPGYVEIEVPYNDDLSLSSTDSFMGDWSEPSPIRRAAMPRSA